MKLCTDIKTSKTFIILLVWIIFIVGYNLLLCSIFFQNNQTAILAKKVEMSNNSKIHLYLTSRATFMYIQNGSDFRMKKDS